MCHSHCICIDPNTSGKMTCPRSLRFKPDLSDFRALQALSPVELPPEPGAAGGWGGVSGGGALGGCGTPQSGYGRGMRTDPGQELAMGRRSRGGEGYGKKGLGLGGKLVNRSGEGWWGEEARPGHGRWGRGPTAPRSVGAARAGARRLLRRLRRDSRCAGAGLGAARRALC